MISKTENDGVVKGLEAGAAEYLVKPFDANEMLARIGVGRGIIDLQRQLEHQSAQLEEVARTNSFTGLPNCRAIEERGSKQLKGAFCYLGCTRRSRLVSENQRFLRA